MEAILGLNGMLRIAESAMTSVRTLPAGVHISAVIALMTDLILWLSGGKVLKPAFAFVGLSLGALAGSLVLPHLAPDRVASIPSPYIGMAVGAVLGLALATVLFRFAMSIAGAVTFACVGVLGVALHLSISGGLTLALDPARQSSLSDAEPSDLRQKLDEARKSLQDTGHIVITSEDIAKDKQLKESAAAAATRTREFVDQMNEDASALWKRLPEHSRVMLMAGGGAGALLGFLLGAFAPKKTSGITTALLGAGIWLTAAAWIVRAADVTTMNLAQRVEDLGPVGWAAIWTATALFGLIVQLKQGKKQTETKPKPDVAKA
jgi:MFS family permease